MQRLPALSRSQEKVKRNPSMSEEEWRCFQLSQSATKLSASEIASLEKQLLVEPANLDIRVQVFAYYSERQGNGLKYKNADRKLSEQILWWIENFPSVKGFMGYYISKQGSSFKPKTFAALRQAWLEQVSRYPLDGALLGNAACFIAWNDFETASELFERADEQQPNSGLLGFYLIHCNAALQKAPAASADKLRKQVIDVGIRSLEDKAHCTPFLDCMYVSDAALELGSYDIVNRCAEILQSVEDEASLQMANGYLGLVALRQNNLSLAVELLLKAKSAYLPLDVTFRLAKELFDAGERDSIVQLIMNLKKRTTKASARKRWLKQIANDERPDFDY